MYHYMVICQFQDNRTPSDFLEAIAHIDEAFEHPIKNIWYIQSFHSIDYIQQTLLSLIDLNDVLIINEIKDQRGYNMNKSFKETISFDHEISKFLV